MFTDVLDTMETVTSKAVLCCDVTAKRSKTSAPTPNSLTQISPPVPPKPNKQLAYENSIRAGNTMMTNEIGESLFADTF